MADLKWIQIALLVFVLIGLMLGASCNQVNSAKEASKGVDGSGLPIVTLVPDKQGAAFNPSDFTTSVERNDGGFLCTIYSAEGYSSSESVFLAASYNPDSFHAYNVKVGPAVDQDTLGIATEAGPGRIVAGLVNVKSATLPALESGMAVCSFMLIPGAADKIASNVADNKLARAKNLELSKNAEEAWVLAWDYTNPGDSDQDGEVGIRDLQPIASNYLAQVNNSWDDPLRHIDGDSNGEINSADVVPIASNFNAQVWAYQIEMSESVDGNYIVVGQLILGDQQPQIGETVRFEYTFGAQYVEHAWYRVTPILPNGNSVEVGTPSESICEDGRRMDPIEVPEGATVTIVVKAQNLPSPITHMNAARVIFPETFTYVPNSANPGAIGGSSFSPDGIWSTFAEELLFPPDTFMLARSPGSGFEGLQCIDFNVTSLVRFLDTAPVAYGDLFNFQLKNTGSEPLTLLFQGMSEDNIKRTYYSDIDNANFFFGNSISFEVK
jgi:hypothetical protein